MIERQNVAKRTIYYQMETTNKSFLDMHHFLKAKGIQNNKFFLILLDPDLAGVNPRDPRLNQFMKQKILREVICNYWYFLREVCVIPEAGGVRGSGARFQLHRGNLALNFCIMLNCNIFQELPRQQGKTAAVLCRMLWEFQYGTRNAQIVFINKKHDDSKENLQRLKEYRDALPEYLQMAEPYGRDGKKIKAKNSVETLEHPLNGNKIRTIPAARNKVAAMSLGRGLTLPRVWYDEYAFTPFNGIIYQSATPAFKTASLNAKKNNAPYGIIITTTPGDLTTEEGMDAFRKKENATKFTELWYDMPIEHITELIAKNDSSSFVHIKFTYQQLGRDEAWFRSMVIDLEKDWTAIRREVLLEWASASDNSPFKKEDLKIVKGLIREPIRTVMLCNYFQFNIYKDINFRFPPLIGVDVSGGFQRDSSAITVLDSETTEVAADFNCNWISTVDLAKVIYELVTKYMNNGIVNIERNGGYGASVLAKLINTKIKKNLYYEVKDKVIEERSDGIKTVKKSKKVKVYGLDSTRDIRELLMEILKERMRLHKDKFISPIIYHELETLEVKKNGKIEHTSTGHDDQVFSYLLALYIWYEGKDLMERYGLQKKTIKTDEDLEEAVLSLEEKYGNIIEEIEEQENDVADVKGQLEYLKSDKTMTFEQWMQSEHKKDQEALDKLLSTKLGRIAYANKYNKKPEDLEQGMYTISNDVFNDFYK